MATNMIMVKISPKTKALLIDCRAIYRNEHPELDEMYLSNNKILYEVCRFYVETYNRPYDPSRGER